VTDSGGGFSERFEAGRIGGHAAEGAAIATIAKHLGIEELEQRHRAGTDVVEAKHLQTIRLLAQGRTFVEVADIVGFVPR